MIKQKEALIKNDSVRNHAIKFISNDICLNN